MLVPVTCENLALLFLGGRFSMVAKAIEVSQKWVKKVKGIIPTAGQQALHVRKSPRSRVPYFQQQQQITRSDRRGARHVVPYHLVAFFPNYRRALI
jgi:hypothetical protein